MRVQAPLHLREATDPAEREARDKSDFLNYGNDDNQQADFHSPRHTYLSRLGRLGASPKVMQKLARHSTIELTLGRFVRSVIGRECSPPAPGQRRSENRAGGHVSDRNGRFF